METNIWYELQETYDGTKYHVVASFETEQECRARATTLASVEEERTFKLVQRVSSNQLLDTITVPILVRTVQEIAEDIIDESAGLRSWVCPADYDRLNAKDLIVVHDLVNQELDHCELCGMLEKADELTEFEGGLFCDRCVTELEEERDEELEDED